MRKKFPKESFPPPRCHVSQRSDSSLRISLRCFSSCLRKQTCVKERQLQMSQQRNSLNFNIRDGLIKATWQTKQPCIGIRRLCETVCEDSLSHLSHCVPACARSVIQISREFHFLTILPWIETDSTVLWLCVPILQLLFCFRLLGRPILDRLGGRDRGGGG